VGRSSASFLVFAIDDDDDDDDGDDDDGRRERYIANVERNVTIETTAR
jgi:hypothetical protein